VIVGAPVQVPLFAVKVLFSAEEPEIVGGCAFFGGPALALTTFVAFELKLAVPSWFVAITRERIRCPTSALAST